MKKWRDLKFVLYVICFSIMAISYVFSIIYEYFIWNKSIVPDIVFNAFTLPGLAALAALVVIYLVDKKKKKK